MTQFDKRNISMMMDLYEMTMAYGYYYGRKFSMKILKDTEVLTNCDTSFLLRKTYLKNFRIRYNKTIESKLLQIEKKGAGMRSKSPELISEIKKYIEDYYL